MVTTGALLHGDIDRHLRFSKQEHPIVLQLGGSHPEDLAKAAKMGEDYGYDEINLNCGCPSDRVQNGSFGACLMAERDHVAHCMEVMKSSVDIPVSIKCRIGIDDFDDLSFLLNFVDKSMNKGVTTFVIHARKAWLKGLSPKQNREIPPLDYDRVKAVKEKYPQLRIILNGGLTTTDQIANLYNDFDGFMIGREAYSNPYLLAEIEHRFFDNSKILERDNIAIKMHEYAKQQFELHGTPVKAITRHILGLYHKQAGAKAWKRYISENAPKAGGDHNIILEALEAVQRERIRHNHNGQTHQGFENQNGNCRDHLLYNR